MNYTHSNIIGIDPGIKGAIAVINTRTNKTILYDCPFYSVLTGLKLNKKTLKKEPTYDKFVSPHGIIDILSKHSKNSMCIIEKSHAMPDQGEVSIFKYGVSYGYYLSALISLGISYIEVSSSCWKNKMMLNESKVFSIIKAISYNPAFESCMTNIEDHNGRAEAYLLAKYYLEFNNS